MSIEHGMLLGLLLVPLAAAVVVALLGPRRIDAIRWISFAASIATLLLALGVAERLMRVDRAKPLQILAPNVSLPTFQPMFVPGSPGVRSATGQTPISDPHGTSWNLLTLGSGAVQFYIGLDGLNVWLVVLTAVLMLPSVLISWNHIGERVNEFYAWLLALQTAMMGIFLAFDIILFYVFFELSLVPLFFLIGIWGGPQRRYAARKFFIYTFLGSMLTLLGVLGVVVVCYQETGVFTFSIPRLVELVHQRVGMATAGDRLAWTALPSLSDIWLVWTGGLRPEQAPFRWGGIQFWVFMALMAGFAVKVPLVPLHTWLPLAHVEAPTAGSVDLAGVLLKVGAYGFLRLCLPLAPDVSLALGLPLVTILATVGIVYGALCAFAQDDVKKLIAYSSVSHLGLCMLGMFTLNVAGLQGSLMQMINHGLSTAGLFLLIGMLYERYHTRQISDYGGMARRMPLFGCSLVFICLSSVGLPGLNGFIGEVLVLSGIFHYELDHHLWPTRAVVASTGIVLGAWYLFTMLRRLLFGPVKEPEHHGPPIEDLSGREIGLLAPIAVLCVLIGVYPQPILETAEPDVLVISDIAERARMRTSQDLAAREGEDPLAVKE